MWKVGCEQIERKVSEVTRLRNIARKSKGKIGTSGKDRDKGGSNPQKKQQQVDIARREAARSKRMQELMRQVGTIIRQVHKSLKIYLPRLCSSFTSQLFDLLLVRCPHEDFIIPPDYHGYLTLIMSSNLFRSNTYVAYR